MLVKNELRHLRRSLPVLLEQDTELPFDLTVIDSGSTDGSLDYLQGLTEADGRVRVVQIPPSEFHHARTRNLGAEITSGRLLVYLGGDAIPLGSSWLRTLAAPILAPRTDVVATYGRQVPRAGAGISNQCRMAYNYGPRPVEKRATARLSAKERYFFSSVACCIDRSRVASPPFDERFPVNEDITLSHRIIAAGSAIAYVPEAVVEHSHEYSSWQVLRRYFDHQVVYEGLGIFGAAQPDDSMRDLRAFLRASIVQLRGHGPLDYARVGAFLCASAIGLPLGRHRRVLPRALRRRLRVYGTVD